MLAVVAGFLITLAQLEILSRPFAYCLPGHRVVLRKYVFCGAAPVSLICSVVFLAYPGLDWPERVVVLCSAFFANLTFYVAAAVAAEGIRNAVLILGFLPIIGIVATGFFNLDVLLERVVVGNVFVVSIVGVLSSVAAWRRLGREGMARSHCAMPWIGFMDIFNKERLVRYQNARPEALEKRFRRHPRPWVEPWFLSRMERYDYSGPGRYYWGALYRTSALAVSGWYNLLLPFFVLTIMFGYIGRGAGVAFVMLTAIFAIGREVPVYSTMLISGGRRRRLTTTFWLVVTDAVLLCLVALAISGLSAAFSKVMPAFSIEGKDFSFSTINYRVAIIPLILLPFASAIELVFYRRPFLLLAALIVGMYVVVFLSFGWYEDVEIFVNPAFVVGSLVAGWGVFLLVLRRICFKWCLVGGEGRI